MGSKHGLKGEGEFKVSLKIVVCSSMSLIFFLLNVVGGAFRGTQNFTDVLLCGNFESTHNLFYFFDGVIKRTGTFLLHLNRKLASTG